MPVWRTERKNNNYKVIVPLRRTRNLFIKRIAFLCNASSKSAERQFSNDLVLKLTFKAYPLFNINIYRQIDVGRRWQYGLNRSEIWQLSSVTFISVDYTLWQMKVLHRFIHMFYFVFVIRSDCRQRKRLVFSDFECIIRISRHFRRCTFIIIEGQKTIYIWLEYIEYLHIRLDTSMIIVR